MIDKEALAGFKRIFGEFATNGEELITLNNGGLLTIYARGNDVSVILSLPRGVKFKMQKMGKAIEIWIRNQVEIETFHLYVYPGEVKLAPNGWVVGTHYGNTVSLGIS